MRIKVVVGSLMALTFLQGCTVRAWNEQARPSMTAPAMAAKEPVTPRSADDVFIVLAFSGGGTRSAAFAYGVLEGLRDTAITIHGRRSRLLNEVNVITSVSGGSYTAAYYGLFGERIFTDFETVFLKRDVQGELVSLLFTPLGLASFGPSDFNRSDIAARWLGDNLFENKKFSDMTSRPGPFIVINASDLNTGMTFSFIQQQFDFLCSRIAEYPVANAVMASSAVPGFFVPIALRNYDGDCPERRSSWIDAALARPNIFSRNYQVARALERYFEPAKMPVVRLADGGVTDNLGVRGSMMSPVMHFGNVAEMAGAFDQARLDRISKVLVVVANAQSYEDYEWSRRGDEPGLVENLSASFDSAIGIMNSETVGLAKRGFMQWADGVNRRPSRRGKPPVDVQFSVLTYDQIRDPAERRSFNAIPTTLSLPARQVDEVRALAKRLLRESPEFQRFVAQLR